MAAYGSGPTLEETDPRLLEILRRAGDEWGPAGVARAAVLLVGRMVAEASGFCGDCPDHEACAQGVPCAHVQAANSGETCREFDKWGECVVCGSEYARVCRGPQQKAALQTPPAFELCHCTQEYTDNGKAHVHKYRTEQNPEGIVFVSCQPEGCKFVGGSQPCWADHK